MKKLNANTTAKLIKEYQRKLEQRKIDFTTYREMVNFIKGEAK